MIICVHGFNFEPGSKHNDPKTFFNQISRALGEAVKGHTWHSGRLSFKGWLKAWSHGYVHPYRHGWALADAEARRLALVINSQCSPVNVICHSLGSRVLFQSLRYVEKHRIERVIILNGAELVPEAEKALACHGWKHSRLNILNVAVSTDDILDKLGSWTSGSGNAPCIGNAGLKHKKVVSITLDSLEDQRIAARNGWLLRGDDAHDYGDHHFSYLCRDNWPLYRAFFAGNNLADFRSSHANAND